MLPKKRSKSCFQIELNNPAFDIIILNWIAVNIIETLNVLVIRDSQALWIYELSYGKFVPLLLKTRQ